MLNINLKLWCGRNSRPTTQCGSIDRVVRRPCQAGIMLAQRKQQFNSTLPLEKCAASPAEAPAGSSQRCAAAACRAPATCRCRTVPTLATLDDVTALLR
ncbi:hypothetical protein K1T71_002585 [Dendrolimus kikuchii]|uniref:Uncharacterized protein n=1 Tax=Dendrolimus kikuchii TaxID=765133 RepID=A0ACC1DD32_9NEOP|nr:hypothetical protein K1T71_002585 [Dendrolimus kikuchii]